MLGSPIFGNSQIDPRQNLNQGGRDVSKKLLVVPWAFVLGSAWFPTPRQNLAL